MSTIEIKQVTNRKELKQFVQFYYDLYRGNNCAVPYLFFDEMTTLRKDKNPSFECCEAEYFMAFRDGKMVGRVAAIINRRANERWNCHQVRFGWFDFIDDTEVSTALLQAVDYNHPYYPRHMEQLQGFQKANDWVEMKVKVPDEVPAKFAKITEMVSKRYGLRVHKFTRNELIKEGWGRKTFDLLNATYKDLYGFSQLSDRQIDKLVNNYIQIADLNLVTAVMDGDKMVGFGITFPSFSEAMQKTRDGRFLPFGWWHLLKVLKWHKTPLVDLLLIGVLPEYRGKGANALIFDDLIRWFQRYHFEYAITGPQMESNEGVLSQWQYLEATPYRRHRCYRKFL